MTNHRTPTSDLVVSDLTKRFGRQVAVDHLSFTARSGRVTGFVGPNGAGKTTTLRALLGLVTPTSGSVTIGGVAPHDLTAPAAAIGAHLDPRVGPAGRRVGTHLALVADLAAVNRHRVTDALAEVELADAARRRIGTLSLGMRQRLGLAVALIAEPQAVVLDEPFNGLDPGGVRWLRERVRALASAGRTVLLSSHLLLEVAQVADDVVMIDHGRLLAAGPIADLGDLETTFFDLTTGREP